MNWATVYLNSGCNCCRCWTFRWSGHRRSHAIAGHAAILKYCSAPIDWIDRSADFHRSVFQALEAIWNSTGSISLNLWWRILVLDTGSGIGETKKGLVADLLRNWFGLGLTSGLRKCAGLLAFDGLVTFNDIRVFLCNPGNGTALDGKKAIDARLCNCSIGFLYRGFEKKTRSLSENCSPQSQSGRRMRFSWEWKENNRNEWSAVRKWGAFRTFFLAACRSCSELNWNVSNSGTKAESHIVVKNVSEYSNSEGNCCSNCHVQSKNSSNIGLCSAESLLTTWPSRSLQEIGMKMS